MDVWMCFCIGSLLLWMRAEAIYKESCKDNFGVKKCWNFKKNKACSTQKEAMKVNCRKTCGFCSSCEDYLQDWKCKQLKRLHACKNNHQKMKKLCPQTCGFCPSNCNDRYYDCNRLKKYGGCHSFPIRMKQMCPDTCGHCRARTSCDGAKCPFGHKCKLLEDGRPVCLCRAHCWRTRKTGPLCGADGRTFANLCVLKKEECKTMKFIKVKHYGDCKKPVYSCADAERESKSGLCEAWRKEGACEKHIHVMQVYCKKTCGICRQPINPAGPKCESSEHGCCWNNHIPQKGKYGDGCKACADAKLCRHFREFCGHRRNLETMREKCPITCGYCLPKTSLLQMEDHRKSNNSVLSNKGEGKS